MTDNSHIQNYCEAVKEASATKKALLIKGSSSKSFYGNKGKGMPFDVTQNSGIVDYEPSELFITVNSGTSLNEIEETLNKENQILAFEPPQFNSSATIGGTIACGLSGPRRPYSGSMRDSILGTNIINGIGDHLVFGGKVMKNVAGYDVSRLMCGSFGTLGIITQASLKVIPKPQHEISLVQECTEQQAMSKMNDWMYTHQPISATYFEANKLYIRLSGLEKPILTLQKSIGGETVSNSEDFWHSIKELRKDFFNNDSPLWRIIVPHNSSTLNISGEHALEWNGGLRWYKSNDDQKHIIQECNAARGYAALFKSQSKPFDCLPSLNTELKNLHLRLKKSFDPNSIFNAGRMYSWC